MKNKIKIREVEEISFDRQDVLPIGEVINMLNNLKSMGANAIEFDVDMNHEYGIEEIILTGIEERDETETEIEERNRKAREYQDIIKKMQEERERAQYLILKEKYGDS